MNNSIRYRVVSIAGTILLTLTAITVANQPLLQRLATTHIPLLWRLEPAILSGSRLRLATGTSLLIILGSLIPLFKPRPWRILNIVSYAQKRILVAGVTVAALGYFNYSFRLPRTTTALFVGILLVSLPLWFVWIRQERNGTADRTLIVGDDREQIERIVAENDSQIVGCLCPPATLETGSSQTATVSQAQPAVADGGDSMVGNHRLGGLSQVESVLVDEDISSVCLAFRSADRGEFFGTLDICSKHGVDARVHREYADDVLTAAGDVETLAAVDVEPWDPQDYLFKRLFDIAFAGFGLLVLSPVILVIALAIKLDSPGPVLYSQNRTAGFGDTFPVYKFRSMIPESESADPIADSENDRITTVGAILRKTHMDEIPQLWSILIGDMSVVGPRAAWTTEEEVIEQEVDEWRKRWFVKPGLTGLAQINDVKSTEPEVKVRYDIRYIREQSFFGDIRIVIRQLWKVGLDVINMIRSDPTQ